MSTPPVIAPAAPAAPTIAPTIMPTPVTFPSDLGLERIGAGRYAVWRRFELAGAMHASHIQCANPAYGFAQLHAWETAIRTEGVRTAADKERQAP